MADSLRDQLIAAGFEAPKKPAKKKPPKKRDGKKDGRKDGQKDGKRHSQKGRANSNKKETRGKKPATKTQAENATEDAAIAARKALKAQIKDLIDNNKLENWKGEIAYRYTVDKRIRELYVNEAALKHLTAREVAITRLNGNTYLVPIETAAEIIKINPQWSVFNATEAGEDKSDDDEYSEFQVPDDLQW